MDRKPLKTIPGDAVAMTPGQVLRIGKEHFSEMLQMSLELGQRLVAIMTDRVREYTRNQQHREKMMSLGKLAAGVAHGIGTSVYFRDPEGNLIEARYYKEQDSSEKCLLES